MLTGPVLGRPGWFRGYNGIQWSTSLLKPRRTLLPITLTAIGVVYGDIGTSPLYALRECFFGSH